MASWAAGAEQIGGIYEKLLGRKVDDAGWAFWEAQLANGMTLAEIEHHISRSPEARVRTESQVKEFYVRYFGREADDAGLAYWVDQAFNGRSIDSIENHFLNADEYRNRLLNGGIGAPGAGGESPPTNLPGTGGGDGTPPTGGTGGGGPGTGIEASARNAVADLESAFSWIGQLGLATEIQQWAVDGLNASAIVGKLRQTSQYQGMFVGIRRDDGTMRVTEAQYLQQMDAYRNVLGNYGKFDERYDTNAELSAFLVGDIDPNELEERLQIYDYVSNNSDVKDAFYVYAGMNVTGDDLYQAVVDPRYGEQLASEYNQRATSTKLDYDTWITRATEVGLARLADQLTLLERQGAKTSQALDQIRSMDPEVAKQFMTLLHLGPETGARQLDLNELTRAFENSLLGSAAISQGLDIPTVDRVNELRNAGITQAQAIKSYGQYSKDQALLRGMASRAKVGDFGQNEFEQGAMLQQGKQVGLMEKMFGLEEALGKGREGGAVGVSGGRFVQQGLRAR